MTKEEIDELTKIHEVVQQLAIECALGFQAWALSLTPETTLEEVMDLSNDPFIEYMAATASIGPELQDKYLMVAIRSLGYASMDEFLDQATETIIQRNPQLTGFNPRLN